ncbi:MAG: GNAT family N-acetyltransferase [Pseudonocardia sp.]
MDQVQNGEPYNYRPGEIAAAEEWFPPLVDRSTVTLLAYGGTDRPVAYCVARPVTGYPEALAVAERLGMYSPDAEYLAELGVSAAQRRQGIASTLLARAIEQRRSSAWVVRTLEINGPAIALYQRHGFHLVPEVVQVHHGRARVFLVRPDRTASRHRRAPHESDS